MQLKAMYINGVKSTLESIVFDNLIFQVHLRFLESLSIMIQSHIDSVSDLIIMESTVLVFKII